MIDEVLARLRAAKRIGQTTKVAVEVMDLTDALAEMERLRAALDTDKAGMYAAGLAAEARVRTLEEALGDLLRSVDARSKLDAGFGGMGVNILQEDAGRLRVHAERARAALREEGPAPSNVVTEGSTTYVRSLHPLRVEDLLDGLPRLSTPEEAVKVMGDGQPLVKMREIK